jgi:class 3 adenylate cyclase
MEHQYFDTSKTWNTAHKRRIKTFVNTCAWIVFLMSFSWSIYWLLSGLWSIFSMISVVMICSMASIYWVRKQRIVLAARSIIVSGGLYILTIYLLTTNPNSGNHTSPFWFIVLALYSYFVLSSEKNKYVKEIIPTAFIVLAFLTYFKIIPYMGVIRLEEERLRVVSMVDLFSSLIIILIITRLFLLEITEAESTLVQYSDRLDGLVDNMLPKSVADRLRKEGSTFAEYIPECSVLFADICGFTPWSEKQSPTQLVDKLNELFTEFDDLAEKMGVTKIKTIGDAYMAAAGAPEYRSDHALALVKFANALHEVAERYPEFTFRCGIHSGPVVAGIIGKKRIIYDLWGDTVNTASRLESHGFSSKTVVSEATFAALKGHYPNSQQMTLTLKGKGEMSVFVLNA